MATISTTGALQSAGASSPSRRGELPRVPFSGVAVIAAASIALALATASECHSVFYWPSVRYGLVLWGWWGCVASALWLIGKRRPGALSFTARPMAVHLCLGCVLGVAHIMALGSLWFTDPNWQKHSTAWHVLMTVWSINRFGIEILVYGFALGIIGIVHLQLRAQRDAMRSLELQRQLSAAHLRALQMQLEPHFLFNTLNAITTLVELGRQEDAAAMLSHLNAILKSTLARDTPEKVPLSQELEIVENYLAIEQVRFADRLRVEMKVERDALDSLVPCFLLQPIVENAIRHGIANCEDSGVVEASARREGDLLRLEIRDSVAAAAKAPKPGNGIGLKNTRERLAHFYEGAYSMEARPRETGGFVVTITIPYERKAAAWK